MRRLFYFIIIFLLLIISQEICFSQIIVNTQTRDKLISYNIDPNNIEQVIDSLETKNNNKRWWLIHWIGEDTIYEAIPKLKSLFQLPNTTRFPSYRYMEQKSIILRAVMQLNDTTFREEFKQELDSLSLDDENYYNIMWFASYIQEKNNDPYG